MKYPWQCKYGGCDEGKAIDSKYCGTHRDEMAARTGQAATRAPQRDTGSLDLFAPADVPPERLPPVPAARGQAPSERAAQSTQQKARGQAITLLRLISTKERAGLTCDELEVISGWSHQTVSGRLWSMEKRGWLERPKDAERTRKTRTGSDAYAYILTERGRDQLRAQAREFAK